MYPRNSILTPNRKAIIISGFLCLFLGVLLQTSRAESYKKLVALDGMWKFSVGDDVEWAMPTYDDTDWDKLYVPKSWEQQGYDEYNGYAWYRKQFVVDHSLPEGRIVLDLGQVDDVGEVYINGKRIGQMGQFPPYFKSAYNQKFVVIVPAGMLQPGKENLIAVRIYDSFHWGGILSGNPGIYQSAYDELLEINLAGVWDFAPDRSSEKGNLTDLSQLNWTSMPVPAFWDNYGYADFDGYAYYRTKFYFSSVNYSRQLYLVLGKIDDIDYVYLNGVKIGDVFDLKGHKGAIWNNGDEYLTFRVYPIPNNVLKVNKTNELVVKVYDYFKDGGIYSGPVGMVSSDNIDKLLELEQKENSNKSFWNWLWE